MEFSSSLVTNQRSPFAPVTSALNFDLPGALE